MDSQLRQRDNETQEPLWNFCLKVDIDNNGAKQFFDLLVRTNTKYVAIESPSYYEGFRYSLKTLQSLPEEFPFQKYIVGLQQGIDPPPYLNRETRYDITCVKKLCASTKKINGAVLEENSDDNCQENGHLSLESNDSIEESSDDSTSDESADVPTPLSSVQLLNHNAYHKNYTSYDRSVAELKNLSTFDTRQFDAFYAALTKQLTVIEGPPGTGKTFVGLKIVKCLLDNKQVWNEGPVSRPILVVCYKNHALDQFLEGIIKFNENVVRIGGNSESHLLDDYKLGTIEKKFWDQFKSKDKVKLDPTAKKMYGKCTKHRIRIKRLREEIEDKCRIIVYCFERILDFDEIKPYIKPQRLAQNFEFSQDSLKGWLDHNNDPNFGQLCRTKLHLKVAAERLDDITDMVKGDILQMEPSSRWILYLYWRKLLIEDHQKQINGLFQTINDEMSKSDKKRVKFRAALCKDAQVIGLTITGAAKHKELVEQFNPRIMIVEEAAEVLEGHVVAAMSSNIDHMILIGDHKQLRPLTNVQELTDKYQMDISLFERLIKNKLPYVALELQHRMRPCISELLKVGNIYDFLRNGDKVKNYPPIRYTFDKNMFFLDHQNIEDNNFCRDVPDKSRSNLYEAKIVVQLVKYFLLHNYSEDQITVLTTYNAQLRLIKQLMFEDEQYFVRVIETTQSGGDSNEIPDDKTSKKKDKDKDKEKKELKVRVSSVDGYQGEENDIIIISFVRSSKSRSIGFLDNKNRMNVALSRARHGLFCVGNFTIMSEEEKNQMWMDIVPHLKKNKCFGEEFTIGCKCTDEQHISMPGQFELLNQQLRNGICKCPVVNGANNA